MNLDDHFDDEAEGDGPVTNLLREDLATRAAATTPSPADAHGVMRRGRRLRQNRRVAAGVAGGGLAVGLFVLGAAAIGDGDTSERVAVMAEQPTDPALNETATSSSTSLGGDAADDASAAVDADGAASSSSSVPADDSSDGATATTVTQPTTAEPVAAVAPPTGAVCPADWDSHGGVNADEIRIAVTAPQTGPLATYIGIPNAIAAYADTVNAAGGIGGRMVTFDVRDDGYDASRTIGLVDDVLADATASPALVITLGSPNGMAVADTLNDACIPHIALSRFEAWGDSDQRPWSFNTQTPWIAEPNEWVRWIEENTTGPQTIGLLAMNNDLGRSFERGLTMAIAESSADITLEVARHDPVSPDPTPEIDQLRDAGATVHAAGTAGIACQIFMGSALAQETPAFVGSPCGEMAGSGDLAPDGPYRTAAEPSAESAWFPGVNDPLVGLGASTGWLLTKILGSADASAGGLSRTSIIDAARNFSGQHPGLVSGIAVTTGPGDPWLIESLALQVWQNDSWTTESVTDLDGQLGITACTYEIETGCAES